MMIFKQNVRIMSCYFLTFKFLLKTYFKLIGLFRFWNLALCNYLVALEAVRSILKLISNPDLSRPGQGTDLNFQNKIDFLKVLNFSFPVRIVGPCMKDVYHLQRAKIYRRNFPPVGFIQSRTVLLIRRQSNPITPHVMLLELFWLKLRFMVRTSLALRAHDARLVGKSKSKIEWVLSKGLLHVNANKNKNNYMKGKV